MYTVAQQVAHVAHTVDWFLDGAFSESGFDLDFEKLAQETAGYTSLKEARDWFEQAMQRALDIINDHSEQELLQPMAEGPVMGGAPRMAIIGGIADHTAHHRGTLAVYARLLGKVPKMPYGG